MTFVMAMGERGVEACVPLVHGTLHGVGEVACRHAVWG